MFALLIGSQALLLLCMYRLAIKPGISPIFSTALTAHLVIWYVSPVFLKELFKTQLDANWMVDYTSYAYCVLLETVAIIITLILMGWTNRLAITRRIREKVSSQQNLKPNVKIIYFAIVGVIIATVVLATLDIGASYWERNAFVAQSEGTSAFNILGIIGILRGLSLALIYSYLIIGNPRTVVQKATFSLCSMLVVSDVIQEVLRGHRIAMLLPVLIIIIRGRAICWPTKVFVRVGASSITVLIILSALLSPIIAQRRGAEDLSLGELIADTNEYVGETGKHEMVVDIAGQILNKFESFSAGAFLIQHFGSSYAGINPYVGSLLAFIPRAVFPEKPVPGSSDATYHGHPSRLVPHSFKRSYSDSMNIGVSPAAISYWQLGLPGLLMMILFNCAQWTFVNLLSTTHNLLLCAISIYLINMPSLATLVSSPDVIILNAERTAIILLLFWATKKMIHKQDRPREDVMVRRKRNR
jgi:hypothetical protein